ncbi:hypothetical protein PCCS19_23530 [Paenibacillus sp. CCS19]|uniref:DUF1684 domain-containing protein n=1 Tax=Paenibacillus sp. CCS19 TaxID=3158387 RepID=UPI002561649E|nr:DUF1684 domain-containing protein [Paenibacillus cellulosilyticus]GMK39299.1 hypothetical protein PCCS19_23530 [Paenibacillus cellulosilyticus]
MMPLEEWRAYRHQSVIGPQGDLALILLQNIQGPARIDGIPGLWAPRTSANSGLQLTASISDGIAIDGRPVEGTITLETDVTVVQFSETRSAMATEQPGSEHLLAVWDTRIDAVQSFESISAYPYDPAWVIEGTYVAGEQGQTASFAHIADQEGSLRHHQSPGDIQFEVAGVSYRMTPFASGESLIIIFGDLTNGQETYGLGRMVLVTVNSDGSVVLDFNRAFLPSCAFSHHFNCPIPPRHNRLPFEVKAGEKQVVHR